MWPARITACFFQAAPSSATSGATPLNATQAVDMVNDVTGFDYTLEEVIDIGRRVWYLKRGLIQPVRGPGR